MRRNPWRASDEPTSVQYRVNVSHPIVIGPGKSMWCGEYPCGIGGRRTISSGAASAVSRQTSAVMRRSVSIGRCGPWSSRVATGMRQTRSSAAARRTSGQVRRS